jgi:hypothetical protein
VLLASLLRDAGLDARIVRGEIDEQEARALLDGLTTKRPPPEEVGDIDSMIKAVERFCLEFELDCSDVGSMFNRRSAHDAARESTQISARYQDAADFLIRVVKQEGLLAAKDLNLKGLVEEARDYFWVEFRHGPGASWAAAHPAFAGREADDFEPQRKSVYAEQVPDELLHKVAFEMVMYQKLGSEEVEHFLVPSWEKPAANLALTPLLFYIASNNLTRAFGDAKLEFDADEIDSDLFLPYFSAGPVNAAFDFWGNSVPLDAAASAFAGVFQAVSNKTNSAASALSQLGSAPSGENEIPKRVSGIEKVISQFTVTAPDGRERRYQRTIYDSRFPVLSADGSQVGNENEQVYQAITRVFTFQVQNGSSSPAQILDSHLATYLLRQPTLEMMLKYQYNGGEIVQSFAGNNSSDQISWQGFEILSSIFDSLPHAGAGPIVYRDQPNIIIHHKTFPFSDTIREAIDIVQNSRRAYARVDGELEMDPDAIVKTGVWETFTEGALLLPNFKVGFNAMDVFENSREQGFGTRIIINKTQMDGLKLPTMAVEAIGRDLAMGYAIVLPAIDSAKPPAPIGWWRMDPDTGETLGIGINGEGTDGVEYTKMQRVVAFAVIGGASFVGCMLIGAGANAQMSTDNPARVTGGDCVAFGLAMGVGAASGTGIVEGLKEGFGFGVASYVLGKLVDFSGALE